MQRLPRRTEPCTSRAFLLSLILLSLTTSAVAGTPRVLPEGKLPDDKRLKRLKTLNDYFPLIPPKTPQQWEKRSERVRRQVLVATGLWPMPTKTAANAVIHGKVDREQYTVEKVYLESFPGHFVTGNLYRPKGRSGRLPGVLCPHGHWPNGRFYDRGPEKIRWALVEGRERFEVGGRYVTQARCVQLARMGCVVFHYDMVGYADSRQLEHRPGVREHMNTPENWGYFSPQAVLRMQNMMGLQTYNSIRVLDWFRELPEVDADRIAVTGASGGGTQTFILCATDPRPVVAFPAVMVSTAMQGGCTCENACYLRVDSGNIEIAGLMAPRPLGMTAADDWTKEIATKGLPELKQLYKMLGVEDRVMAKPLVHFKHNYNYVSRAVMYHWMNKHLALGFEEPIVEENYQPLSRQEMSVWNDDHPKPPGGEDYERSLLRWITEDNEKQMAALVPSDQASLVEYRRIVGGAIDVMVGRGAPAPRDVQAAEVTREEMGDWVLEKMLVRHAPKNEELPMIVLRPNDCSRHVVIWVDKLGKQAVFDEQKQPGPAVAKLLAAGVTVVGVDLFGQGEFTTDGRPIAKQRTVHWGDGKEPWMHSAVYTYGYNHSLFAKRVHDLLSVLTFVRSSDPQPDRIDMVGLAGAGHWVAAARAQAGAMIDRVAIDTAGFRFAGIDAADHPDFWPGGAKHLDLPGVLALSAPYPTWLAGEGAAPPPVVMAAYQAAAAREQLTVSDTKEADSHEAAVEWLLK